MNISDFKSNIIDPLIKAFNDIGIKVNLSRGDESHRNSIESLHQSDLILFFIAPYNEKQIQNCLIDKCSVISCPLKFNEQNVSNLYCELQLSSNIDKPLIIFNFNIFPKTKNNEYQLTLDIIDEIKKSDLNFGIFQYNDFNNSNLEKIKFQIAEKICEWHKEDQIKFKNFCGRKDKLHQIISNMEQSIEVYGVGGIGKTALIQVALLIEKFKGKKIISVGPKQVYISHSGYEIFRRKCFDAFHITDKYRITLDDIIDALSSYIPDISSLRKDTIERKYNQITNSITRENLILFIDDFHLADIDTQNLIKYTDHIIFSSRKKNRFSKQRDKIRGY
ncbi:MAG: ATP-binding protein [Promethearchaeota archaeon]